MQIPIDVTAVFKEATDVEAARNVPLNVSVLLDESAPDDLVAFVRSSFASASVQARVSINYFVDGNAAFDPRSDMAVVAAGCTEEVGGIVARLRESGIPAMVVTTLPTVVSETAQRMGNPIPAADLIAPEIHDGDVVMFSPAIRVSVEHPQAVRGAHAAGRHAAPGSVVLDDAVDAGSAQLQLSGLSSADPLSLEPYALTEEFKERLSMQMGEWIVETFRRKRLAFAQAFPFVRKPLSRESVNATSIQNAGIGLVVFIPGADMPIMTLNQAKMLLQIAAAYGQPLGMERVKELACVVGGGFACRAVARQVVGIVPALGWAVKAGIGYAGTLAMGNAAIEYFEHGGTMVGLAAAVGEARDKAVAAAERTSVGRAAKEAIHNAGDQVKAAAAEKAKETVKAAPSKIAGAIKHAAQAGEKAAAGAIRSAVRK